MTSLYLQARDLATSRKATSANDLMRALGIPWNAANSLLEQLERDRLLASPRQHVGSRRFWSPGVSPDDRLAHLAPREPSVPHETPPPPPEPTTTSPTPRLVAPSNVTRSMVRHHIANNHPGSVLNCPDCLPQRRIRSSS